MPSVRSGENCLSHIQWFNDYLRLLRPKQWVKNIFVFLPAFFAGRIADFDLLRQSFIAFISLCLLASVIYVLNDVMDRAADRSHPVKRNRPVASGRASVRGALILAFVLCICGLAVAAGLGLSVLALACLYLAFNLAYRLGLKHLAIFDVFFVSCVYV
ncbi:hypothetical protein EG832_16035, partial [bacterium]|nr:hypothetical protein [bacterium]